MIQVHPGTTLRRWSAAKLFQAAALAAAAFLFVGLDANFSETIDREPALP